MTADTSAMQLEDIADRFPIAPADKLLSYPYDRTEYGIAAVAFVTQDEADRQDLPFTIPTHVAARELPLPAAGTHSAVPVLPVSSTSAVLQPQHRCELSIPEARLGEHGRSALLHRQCLVSVPTADGTAFVDRCITLFGVFFRSHPSVPEDWLRMVLDDEAGYAPYLLHREDGLGGVLIKHGEAGGGGSSSPGSAGGAQLVEETRLLAEHIEARTVEFNAWLDRSKSVPMASAEHGVHGVVLLAVDAHLFQVTIGPANVMITHRAAVAGPTPTTTTAGGRALILSASTRSKRKRTSSSSGGQDGHDDDIVADGDGSSSGCSALLFVHPPGNPEVDWMPQAPRARAWRQKRVREQTELLEAEVRERRADPFPEQCRRFDPPFIAGDDPARADHIVVHPRVPVDPQHIQEIMSADLCTVTTPPGLWATVPGVTLAEKSAVLAGALYDETTGAPTGLCWPPPPLHPSRVFLGASSHPPYAHQSQAVPFIMRWELLTHHGAHTPMFAVLGDDHFFHTLYRVASLPHHARLIKDYRIEYSNAQSPSLHYARPNFGLDRAKDLLAWTIWNAADGQEVKAIQDVLAQDAGAPTCSSSSSSSSSSSFVGAPPPHVDVAGYPWPTQLEQRTPAFLVARLTPAADSIPSQGPGAGPAASHERRSSSSCVLESSSRSEDDRLVVPPDDDDGDDQSDDMLATSSQQESPPEDVRPSALTLPDLALLGQAGGTVSVRMMVAEGARQRNAKKRRGPFAASVREFDRAADGAAVP